MICPYTGVDCLNRTLNCTKEWCALRSLAPAAVPAEGETPTVQQIIDRSSHCMVEDGARTLHDAVKAKVSDLRLIERKLAQMAAENARICAAHKGLMLEAERRVSELEAALAEKSRDAERIDLTPQELAGICTFSFGMSCDSPEDAEPITIGYLRDHESGPGWYVWCQDHPEEGSVPVNTALAAERKEGKDHG